MWTQSECSDLASGPEEFRGYLVQREVRVMCCRTPEDKSQVYVKGCWELGAEDSVVRN